MSLIQCDELVCAVMVSCLLQIACKIKLQTCGYKLLHFAGLFLYLSLTAEGVENKI